MNRTVYAATLAALLIPVITKANPSYSYVFDVKAGPIGEVVSEISKQSQRYLKLNKAGDETVALKLNQVRSNGVQGQMSVKQALDKAFAGTGLSISADKADEIIVKDEVINLQAVNVVADRVPSKSSSLATRTDTELKHVASTVDTVDNRVMQARNVYSTNDALKNIPGVTNTSAGGWGTNIGQEKSGGTFTDGLRNSTLLSSQPAIAYESVEVLKGPASILTGTQVSGGVVNYVSKKAELDSEDVVSVGAGSGNERIYTVDVGGELVPNSGVAGRTIVAYSDADRIPGGGINPISKMLKGLLSYQNDDLRIDGSLQYSKQFQPLLDRASYNPETKKFNKYGDRINEKAGTDTESYQATFDIEKDLFNNDYLEMKLRGKLQYQDARYNGTNQSPTIYDFAGMGSVVANMSTYGTEKNVSSYIDLYSKFSTGPVEHQLIIALDGNRNESDTLSALGSFFTQGETHPLLKTYKKIPGDNQDLFLTSGQDRNKQYGILIQDQVALGKWHAMLGFRNTVYNDDNTAVQSYPMIGTSESKSSTRIEKFLPNAGLVYDLTTNTSLFVNYSTAFTPANGLYRTFSGGGLAPSVRTQYETGFKSTWFDDRLSVNMTLFKYEVEDSLMADPSHPNFFINTAGKTGRGGELAISGYINPTLSVQAGYTYDKTELVDGGPVYGYPTRTANLWLLKNLYTDIGVFDFSVGANYNDGFYTTDVMSGKDAKYDRSFVTLDTGLGYSLGKWRVNGTVDNLLNRTNYQSSSSTTSQFVVDKPRTFRLTVSREF